jgi:hypothetical protein
VISSDSREPHILDKLSEYLEILLENDVQKASNNSSKNVNVASGYDSGFPSNWNQFHIPRLCLTLYHTGDGDARACIAWIRGWGRA